MRLHTDHPTILKEVFHAALLPDSLSAAASLNAAVAPASSAASAGEGGGGGAAAAAQPPAEPISSTMHSFVLPATTPFVGGGEAADGVVLHFEFPEVYARSL